MTPKQKSKELFKKYSKGKDSHGWSLCEFDSCAKQCALIAVDEIIKETKLHDKTIYQHGRTAYWEEVKQEIHLL
jgi:hypothetical protein